MTFCARIDSYLRVHKRSRAGNLYCMDDAGEQEVEPRGTLLPADAERDLASLLTEFLGDTRSFSKPVDIDRVCLVNEWPGTDLEVHLRVRAHADVSFVLRTHLADWHFPSPLLPTPYDWAAWIYDAVQERVDADTSGLPKPKEGERVVVVSF